MPKLDASRLVEGVRDFLLRNVRENGMKKPWNKLTEGEQRLEIERATDRADQLVTDIVDIVASGDFPVVHAIIDNYTSKNGEVKIVAKGVASDEVILNLHHAAQKPVKIVVADRQQFDQSRSNLKPDPDEPGLPGVKQEIQPDELKGGFDDDDEDGDQVDEPPAFDDAEEQAAGDAALKPKSDQWRGGFNSRMAGHKREENPFNVGSVEAADWFAGWEAGDFDDRAPRLDSEPVDSVTDEVSEEDFEASGDTDMDGDMDASDPAPDDETDPPHDPDTGEVLPTPEDLEVARDAGVAARKDGQSPKKNPHEKDSPLAQAWTDGYLAQKAAEAKDSKPGDAAFDD